jgi:hypothetical protein
MGMDGPTFDKWFAEELKANKDFAALARARETYYERHKEYFGNVFTRQGTGDWNLFKLFIERDLSLCGRAANFRCSCPAASRPTKAAPIFAAGSSPSTGSTN